MTGRCSWRRLCLSCSKIPGSHTKGRCPPHTTLWVQTVGPSHEGAAAAFPSSQVEDASQGSLVQAGCSEESNLCEQFARPSCPWVWPLFLLHTRPDHSLIVPLTESLPPSIGNTSLPREDRTPPHLLTASHSFFCLRC